MDLWYPPAGQPHLQEWWQPVLLASRAARIDRCPWPIHPDEIRLKGRVDRGVRPSIWIYQHVQSRGELYLDPTGQAYRFTKTPNARSLGRFTPCSVRAAVFQASLPGFVAPVWYDEPPADLGRWHAGADGTDDDVVPQDPGSPIERTRGHLTLIEGGRPLAG